MKINDGLELNRTAQLCKNYLNSSHTITLMVFALSRVSLLPLSADDIERLAHSALSDQYAIRDFYKKLLDEQLKIKVGDDVLQVAVKLDLGIEIIDKYIVLLCQTDRVYQGDANYVTTLSAAERLSLRSDLIKGFRGINLHSFINNSEKIRENHARLSTLRADFAELRQQMQFQAALDQCTQQYLETFNSAA